MSDNSNIKFNKDELEVDEITYEDNQFEWQVRVACGTEEIAEQIKQQILDNQKIVERLKKEIEYKEGWVRVNAYRITDHQTKLVKNEIKELKSILKENQP